MDGESWEGESKGGIEWFIRRRFYRCRTMQYSFNPKSPSDAAATILCYTL